MLINKVSWKQLETFCQAPAHTLLVSGEAETAGFAASTAASTLLGIGIDRLAENQYVLIVGSSGASIGIDEIRTLKNFTRLTVPSKRTIARVCIIQNAEKLTNESQNALLKLLEEPPSNTVLILSTVSASSLLPTILSRAQHIQIQEPTLQEVIKHYSLLGHAPALITRAFALANGSSSAIDQILNGSDSATPSAIEEVKEVLSLPLSARLSAVGDLSKDTTKLLRWLDALEQICHGALLAAAKKDSLASCKRWHKALKLTFEAKINIGKNASPKLVLTDLLLHM